MRWCVVVALLFTAVGAACAEATEIVIEVHSDLRVPDELNEVRIEAVRDEVRTETAVADLTMVELPQTLTLVHRGGSLGPIDVRVDGMQGASAIVTRQLSVHFEEGRSLRLRVDLDTVCRSVRCPTESTCAGGVCRSAEVEPCEYAGRDCADAGAVTDAPVDDGGVSNDACAVPETCNEMDDDCDGEIDEGFDVSTDDQNCGRCGRACPDGTERSSGPICIDSTCALACDTGWGDCNRDPADGCEVDLLTDMAHCGACGAFCPAAGTFHAADAVCTAGRCVLSCDVDWGDCDDDRATGCETHLTVDRRNCGACDSVCPSGQSCRDGSCG